MSLAATCSLSLVESERSWDEKEELEEFGVQVRAEKTAALSHSLGRLRAGMSEAKVRERGCVCVCERGSCWVFTKVKSSKVE